ncbi:PAS domain S-box protein [Romeria aff. gracilis LEGE 07310]|uniref:histidine kinase n=1 Tax=Vasconcelosia minhoensis LEGE 07310 TaxID=915328 RepID=A0A8J7AZR4_9CYAN|nr:PAS domain S-box protein [Romeria gracilis]MBE9079422.1 PAS domain S-box protein [Romeria aff. gracilis LEGE 07310]
MTLSNLFSKALPTLNEVIDAQPPQVQLETPLPEALELMGGGEITCRFPRLDLVAAEYSDPKPAASYVTVLSAGRFEGIFTQADLVHLAAAGRPIETMRVGDAIARSHPTLTRAPEQSLFTALSLLQQHRLRYLPILEADGRLAGVVTAESIRQTLQPIHFLRWRQVGEVMKTQVVQAAPTDSLLSLLQQMDRQQSSSILLCTEHRPVGIVTERDLVQFFRLGIDLTRTQAQTVMSTPLFSLAPEDSLWVAHQQMAERRVRRLVVCSRQGELLGMMTQSGLLRSLDPTQLFNVVETLQKTEAALRASEERYRNLAEKLHSITSHAPVYIYEIDPAGRITFANHTYESLKPDRVVGTPLSDWFPADQRAALQQTIDQVFSTEQVQSLEYTIPNLQGESRSYSAQIAPVQNSGLPTSAVLIAVDITARKQSEASLRQSQANLIKAQEIAKLGSWEFDLTSRRLVWSAEMFRLFGLDPAQPEPVLEQIAELFQADDWETVKRSVAQILHTGQPQQFEAWVQPVNGPMRYLKGRGEAVTEGDGTVSRLVGTAEDISDRKQRQDQLQLLESVILNTNDAILITEAVPIDPPGPRIVYANPAFARMTGYDASEIIGQTPRILQGPKTDRSALGQIRQALSTSQPVRVELINYRKDGSEFWVEIGLFPIRDSSQTVRHYVAVQRDITQRRLNEQKLQEQAALIDIATDAILVRDLDNTLLFWSRGAERIYGWPAAEVLGRNADQVLNPNAPTQIATAWQTVLAQGEWQGELRKHTQSGQERLIESRWTLVRDPDGNPKSVLSVDTDITEKKQLEAQFLRAQRLESIGTLASGIAHDLSNILTPIMGITQLLPLQLTDIDPQTQEMLDVLSSATQRGAALAHQVLSFARGAEGSRTVLSIAPLISEVGQFVRNTFPKNISLSIDVESPIRSISGNATHLHQVLINLCVNARDAMPSGGKLTLSARNFWADEAYAQMNLEARPGPYVLIEAADTGVGMAPNVLEQIFEPFFTTKASGQGTGLGLSTTLSLVKEHEGFIQVSSQVDQGTRFSIYLPAIEQATPAPVDSEDAAGGTGELILVVDDEAPILNVTQTVLENFQYRVLTARDGIEAITLYTEHQTEIAAVLMDIMMPHLEGTTAIRTLQQINPAVQVIATSGLVSSEKLAIEKQLEVQAFLAKPYTAKELIETLHSVLDAA